MIPLFVRLLSAILILYILYLVARKRPFAGHFSKNADPAKREITDYDKSEWERIKKTLSDEFPEDHKKP